MKLVCPICEFRFESDKESSRCPYCGKKGDFPREKSAEEMLEEI